MKNNKTTMLRNMLNENRLVDIVGCHDAISAILTEKAGFKGIWASGLGISAVHGVPDASILNMTEFLNAAKIMNDSTNLPVIADCDTGFGDVNNIKRMINDYENAGIAAVCIEDKEFPKRNSFLEGGQRLADVEEFSIKIKAAKYAQKSSDFMVIARLESFIAGYNLDEALSRALAYSKAGADAILVHSKLQSPKQLYEFSKEWKKENNNIPLVSVPTTYYEVSGDELYNNGYNMVIYANQPLRAMIAAIQDSLIKIRKSGTTKNIENEITKVSEVFELIGTNELNELQNWYDKEVKGLKQYVN